MAALSVQSCGPGTSALPPRPLHRAHTRSRSRLLAATPPASTRGAQIAPLTVQGALGLARRALSTTARLKEAQQSLSACGRVPPAR